MAGNIFWSQWLDEWGDVALSLCLQSGLERTEVEKGQYRGQCTDDKSVW
jgi:hypothetical protein